MHEKICGNELCSPKADQYLVFSLWVSYYPSLQFWDIETPVAWNRIYIRSMDQGNTATRKQSHEKINDLILQIEQGWPSHSRL